MRQLSMRGSSRILFCLISAILLFSYTVQAAETQALEKAPVNPAFTEFMQHRLFLHALSAQSNRLGYIPSPVDRSNLKAAATSSIQLKSSGSTPSSYDLRTLGRVTPVRDQGSCGACWAFGAMASLESTLLPTETWDFSENNLKNTHGFDPGPCVGGGADMSAAYLMRWSGPISESDDPYNESSGTSPTGLTVRKHEQNVIFLPNRKSNTDNDTIKNAIMNYGAVTAGIYWEDGYYNSSNHSYYYNGPGVPTLYGNHEIAIVGWDDNYDRTKFSPAALGNGAFIIKNSWGTSWGESGYFYASYYDTVLGFDELAVFTAPEGNANYSRVYSYDPLGYTGGTGYPRSDVGWFANVFTAQSNDSISAVSFYNAELNSPYEIYVYKDLTNAVDPRSGTLIATKTGTLVNPGYLTIQLTTPVSVTSGHLFSIVVKLNTPGFYWPIPTEYAILGYSSAATASAGQSFISSNGTSWTDTVSRDSTMNVCLKAYATAISGVSEVIWRNTSTGENIVWPMDGTTRLQYLYLLTITDQNWKIVGSGDFSGTGSHDIVWRNTSTGQNLVWLMNGTTRTQYVFLPTITDQNWQIVGVGDFNSDGKPDILWRNSATGENIVWYMNGTTRTQFVYLMPITDLNWQIVGVGDFNNDGQSDILWRNSSTGQNIVWYMNGITRTQFVYLPSLTDQNWTVVGVGDFNKDTYTDILWKNISTGADMVWFLNGITQIGTGSLTPSITDPNWKIVGVAR